MSEGNTQLQLHNDSVEFLMTTLTTFAQFCRVMRQHERAERAEMVRNTIHSQF